MTENVGHLSQMLGEIEPYPAMQTKYHPNNLNSAWRLVDILWNTRWKLKELRKTKKKKAIAMVGQQ